MAPGGEMYRSYERFGENVLRHGSHEWLPYSKNEVRLKSSNTNFPFPKGGFADSACFPYFTPKPRGLQGKKHWTPSAISAIIRE